MPPISLVHPIGNPYSRHAAWGLAETGLLREIITTLAYDPAGRLARWLTHLPAPLSARARRELTRRTWDVPPDAVLSAHPLPELLRLALTRTGLLSRVGIPTQRPVDWLYRHLDAHVAAHHLDGLAAVYAYEDGAATTFARAAQLGIRRLYDLPIMHHQMAQSIQLEEAALYPKLRAAMPAVAEPSWKLERKQQEITLADHIFVASSITRHSLLAAGAHPDRITVIPYGAPVEYFHPRPKPDDVFRALFVGLITPRKGVHYLLHAWRALALPAAELLLVGANQFPPTWLSRYAGEFTHIPSVPHAELNAYYSRGSVFVFPSLVEGFGMVLLEAMACGLPIITTPNTAGPDIITDGVEGFIIPIRDGAALQTKLLWCYEHPAELAEMGRAARRRAEQLTWGRYRQQLGQRVLDLLEPQP